MTIRQKFKTCVDVGNCYCRSPGVTLVDALVFRNFSMLELDLMLSVKVGQSTKGSLLLPGAGHHFSRPTFNFFALLRPR